MLLKSVKVGPFKSIETPQSVDIDEQVTVLVGMNEAGKTVFLQALEKTRDITGVAAFDPVEDYPRKDLPTYEQQHKKHPAEVVVLRFRLTENEVKEANAGLHTKLPADFGFTLNYKYDNKSTVGIHVEERPFLDALIKASALSAEVTKVLKRVPDVRAIPGALKGVDLKETDKQFLAAVEARIAKVTGTWQSVVEFETWTWLASRVPKFLYFGDYAVLPSKMNLADLGQRVEQAKNEPKKLEPKHRGILALLRMANIGVTDFAKPGGYEPLKARIEGVSIRLTDQIMEFWKQNENLEVEVDIRPDPEDQAPYNNGPNLYLRIKNRRHRGVSTPFRQRSRGFIWFFSFLVWFDAVQQQLLEQEGAATDVILLLDEPGLSLHALAQEDFLRYIDRLASKHQVVYTTHSPFMVNSDRLRQVRVVEDKPKTGSIISDNLEGSDPRTIFPLQAALGWTIAQNLFISERNLLVEGPSELIYLKAISAILESQGRTSLRDDVIIVPAGGLDKVVTFVALLGANGLKLAVLHDYRGAPEQRLLDLVKDKMISSKAVLNASQFRDLGQIGKDGRASDIEDLFDPAEYVQFFNQAYSSELRGVLLTEADLPPGDRILDRIERHLPTKGLQMRPSGGFNHYRVASHFVTASRGLEADTLSRFEALFRAVNALF